MAVAIQVFIETRDEEMAAVAALHRVFRDTSTTDADLLAAGFSGKVRGGIAILTQGDGENLKDYIKRVGRDDPNAIRIKIIELREGIQNLGLTATTRNRHQKAMRHLIEALTIETI
jgi:hypothetical protein